MKPFSLGRHFRLRGLGVVNGIDLDQHAGLLIRYAHKCAAKLPRDFEVGDLLGHGYRGLVHAAKNYRPERGLKFSTYASRCIHGFMLSGMEVEGPVQRKNLRNARKHGRATVPYIQLSTLTDDERRGVKWEPSSDRSDPISSFDVEHLRGLLADALERLPLRSRQLVLRRVYGGETLASLAATEGISREGVRLLLVRAFRKMKVGRLAALQIQEVA